MLNDGKILIGKAGEKEITLNLKMANRHGLIAGATGTGKTTTLKVLAESFSAAGVPVFFADVKGDLGSIALEGEPSENAESRIESMGLRDLGFRYDSFPATFWDVYGESGLPLRTTVSEMGPLLFAEILNLNDTQRDVLSVIFKIADDEDLLLIDIKDLKAMVRYVAEKRQEYAYSYGNLAPQTLAAITRSLVSLEAEGGEQFIGEPAMDIRDWLTTDENGKGTVQVMDCRKLILAPKMYSMFLMWLLSELFEVLPEVGDPEKPRLVFFFDEAHLLFEGAPKALITKIEQVVKLIRSKGVGIYFITQSPSDFPDGVLAQLGNKIQHALHAYTPAEMKKLRAAAEAFRENPEFNTLDTLQELGVGKAIVSVLDEEGVPTVAEITKICPPESFMGTLDDDTRAVLVAGCALREKYQETVDRDSAFEFMERRRIEADDIAAQNAAEKEKAAKEAAEKKEKEKKQTAEEKRAAREAEKIAKTGAGTVGREFGKTVGGAIGGSFGKKLGGNLGAALGRGLIGTFFHN